MYKAPIGSDGEPLAGDEVEDERHDPNIGWQPPIDERTGHVLGEESPSEEA